MTGPTLWADHVYMDLEDVDDADLGGMARVSPPGWSPDRPDTAMVHFGPQGTGISLIGTVPQLRRLLERAVSGLADMADDHRPGS